VPERSCAVVTAAGLGERFGGAKLLADVGGEPLLNRTIGSLLDGGVDCVIVVVAVDGPLGSPGASPVALLSDPRVRVAVNPDPSRGMFSSIQTGVAAADAGVILVLPGDMPFVRSGTVAAVLAEARRTGRIVSPRFDGERGHPLALPRALGSEILTASAGGSLKQLLKAHARDRIYLDVDDRGILRDVDTREDL
jgi:molybdenum cofactor cytidylyltransferase